MSSVYLDRARELRSLIDENAAKADGMPIPQETINALVDAELHKVMVPAAVGGVEMPVNDCIDIWAEIARADGSVGWCLMASCATTAYFGAWCPDEHVEQMFADGVPLSAGQFAPNGTAVGADGGYRISGRYSFGSGINHAQWAGAGVFTQEPDGADPRFLFAIYPAEKAQITGNWEVMGLQGTASYDYTVDDVYVPAAATFDMFNLTVYRGGPLYELGVMPLTAAGHAGFAIGVVRRGLDELLAVARAKHRMGDAAPMAQSDRFIHEIGELESRFRAACCWLHDTFANAERTAAKTGAPDPTEALLTRQATAFITQEGADILRRAYLLAGTDALRAGGLQRAFRDIHAGTQHYFAGAGPALELGQTLLAAAPDNPLDA
ncbi:MAG: acyl-CoA dehydrogenase family protein [bacterium]|nr:acyl-CoA dehydrogenase family protein [bacterium]